MTGRPERVFTAPNVVTFLRFALVPLFVTFYLTNQPGRALTCFAVASLSDGLDGLLARVLAQRSKLGALLDPIADKVLVFAALLVLVSRDRLPHWLLYLVVGRDLYMAAVALAVHVRRLGLRVTPSRVGKYATFSLFVLVVLCLVHDSGSAGAWIEPYVPAVGTVAALAVAVSTLQYLSRFSYVFFPARRAG